ncbi:MAG: PliI family lysozyme inhibitor of I-type lysozyme [Desulfuromonadaceae bacterium]
MKALCTLLLVFLVMYASIASADSDIRQEPVRFQNGSTEVQIKGRIKGRETVDYLVHARPGQLLSVAFKPGNSSCYFNVHSPETEEDLFVGSTYGNNYEARLTADGVYTIRVYLMRNAARRNETSAYRLTVSLTDPPPAPRSFFDRTLEMQGIRFHVVSDNEGSFTKLNITPSGLNNDNTPIVRKIEGIVTGAEVADINADGSPEIYVYAISAGSGSYGSLIAYSANRRASLSEIYLPPLAEDRVLSTGYMGHDQFAVLEGVLGRRFPVYLNTDSNAKPTGGMRQLQYKLVPGEAGWVLRLDRTVEY